MPFVAISSEQVFITLNGPPLKHKKYPRPRGAMHSLFRSRSTSNTMPKKTSFKTVQVDGVTFKKVVGAIKKFLSTGPILLLDDWV